MIDNFANQAYSPQYVRTLTMCVHISPDCNLNCKYCFKKVGGELSFADVQRFIDCCLQVYPHADRYIVDMSGAGEPLLKIDTIIKIARYCKELSDIRLREFLPTMVTNGTLLTEQTVKILQSEGVLFGVSIDGTRETHDKNRLYRNGTGSYDIIQRNVMNIRNNKYVGAAVTYTDSDLLRSFLNAIKLLPTVSMKPVRYIDPNAFDADAICGGYDELVEFVLDKTIKTETEYIYALVNGDDYFGKFLKRVVLKTDVYGRCDAGIGRFALAGDKKIYCCPAAAGIKDGEVGDLENGIRRSEILKTWNKLNNPACSGCAARGVCGGECKIVSYNRYGSFDGVDPTMCKIKRHLYELSKMFVSELSACNNEMLDWLEKTCAQIEAYYDKDDRLITAVRLAKGRYTFTEMKKIKDGDLRQFEAIYNELKKSSCS